MKFILILICSSLFVACKCHKKIVSQDKINKEEMIIIGKLDTISDSSDVIKVEDAKIVGNKLEIKVSYGGGCENHSFELIGSPNISKSLPPIRSIQLIHRANKDACKALIIKDLLFDISAFTYKKESGSTIYLQLDGWDQKLLYTYP
jgi:hypothetical protein